MSHTTTLEMTTSSGASVKLILGSRQLAVYANVDVGNQLTLRGEEAANFINRPRVLHDFLNRRERELVVQLFSIELEYQSDFGEEFPTVSGAGVVDDRKFYEHFEVRISHND